MTARLHTFPDAAEIVAAVREFLAGEVMPGTTGALSFHARVAANLLATLEREIAAGSDAEDVFAGRLAALGVADEDELARMIRDRRAGLDTPSLVDTLAWATRERLKVANPKYLDDDLDDDPRG